MLTPTKPALTCDDTMKQSVSDSGVARHRRKASKAPKAAETPTGEVLARLRLAQAARDEADGQVVAAVADGRALGLTWDQLGQAVGISRQAARQRWGRS